MQGQGFKYELSYTIFVRFIVLLRECQTFHISFTLCSKIN